MLRFEATLVAAGRVIHEAGEDGEVLKAECKRVLGYDDTETSNLGNEEIQSDDGEIANNPESDEAGSDGKDQGEPTAQSDVEYDCQAEVDDDHTSDNSTIWAVHRFVLRSLAEVGTHTRVLGEPLSSSPARPSHPGKHGLTSSFHYKMATRLGGVAGSCSQASNNISARSGRDGQD